MCTVDCVSTVLGRRRRQEQALYTLEAIKASSDNAESMDRTGFQIVELLPCLLPMLVIVLVIVASRMSATVVLVVTCAVIWAIVSVDVVS